MITFQAITDTHTYDAITGQMTEIKTTVTESNAASYDELTERYGERKGEKHYQHDANTRQRRFTRITFR